MYSTQLTKTLNPRPVKYVRGEDVPFMNYEVDSPEFWEDYHTRCRYLMKKSKKILV